MATADQETQITFFACPYLQCDQCGKRAVGIVGAMNQVVNLLNGLITVSLPASARNWPCYHVATRTCICDNWTSTTGCQHDMDTRAAHSNQFAMTGNAFEQTRR